MLSAIINFLFPAVCIACGDKGAYICRYCLSKCSPPRPQEEKWVASLFSYQDPVVKQAIWEIKYHGRFVTAYAFGELLAESAYSLLAPTLACWAEREEYCDDILIVPIPPSSTGKKKRGYNQAVIIAEALYESTAFPAQVVKNALVKVKETERQATLHDRSVRLRNMDGAFAVNARLGDALRGRIILLVDDVTTTGATLVDAKRALIEAGVREVWAVTIGH